MFLDKVQEHPIAISILVKNPETTEHGKIYHYDIGDYLTREQKLEKISNLFSLKGISDIKSWEEIIPDTHGDWVNKRDNSFTSYTVVADKKNNEQKIFDNITMGVLTSRDSWCWNFSRKHITDNMKNMVLFYNNEVDRLNSLMNDKTKKERLAVLNENINTNPTNISWSRALKNNLAQQKKFIFSNSRVMQGMYRPFLKQWTYFDRSFNEMVYQMFKVFPNKDTDNVVIHTSGVGAKNFSTMASACLPCYDNIEKGQCFPLYIYDEDGSNKRDAITDEALQLFQSAYPTLKVSKEDIFYYIYGLLHSEDYRSKYADNLSKELPRIPRVKETSDFTAFCEAGRKLAELHINYENVDCYKAEVDSKATEDQHYYVEKMKHPKKKVGGKSVNDLSSIIYNHRIIINNIPEEAYRYKVNGKSAIAWVMERQCVKTDKASGIVNDANLWATETMNNPKYPLELVLRVITVSLETTKIVDSLPKLDFNTLS